MTDQTPLTAERIVPFLRSVVASGERLTTTSVDAIAEALAHPSDGAGTWISNDEMTRLLAATRREGIEYAARMTAHPSDAAGEEAVLVTQDELAEALHAVELESDGVVVCADSEAVFARLRSRPSPTEEKG